MLWGKRKRKKKRKTCMIACMCVSEVKETRKKNQCFSRCVFGLHKVAGSWCPRTPKSHVRCLIHIQRKISQLSG